MIEYKTGDILKQEAEALVNAVNCVGVMGGGLALQIKRAFPANFIAYEQACRNSEVNLGEMWVFDAGQSANPRYIINFPTLRDWQDDSRLADITTGLDDLRNVILARDIKSIAVPALGCGLGGLNWDEVCPQIEAALHDLDGVDVLVFTPDSAPEPEPSG